MQGPPKVTDSGAPLVAPSWPGGPWHCISCMYAVLTQPHGVCITKLPYGWGTGGAKRSV